MLNVNNRADQVVLLQRILLSGLIAAHGWARWYAGGIEPFGIWLDGLGFPMGIYIAYSITALEIVGTLALLAGKYVFGLSLAYAAVYSVGLVLVHAPHGWFVVGLGRNGMEYSVLLISCLLGLAYCHAPKRDN